MVLLLKIAILDPDPSSIFQFCSLILICAPYDPIPDPDPDPILDPDPIN